ncbi:hypothetical protein BD309DRAFT_451603 [Dichomitus squalens]|nr:hypothetical protein BD309DRAFT_451603 [Dichomitus squalens]
MRSPGYSVAFVVGALVSSLRPRSILWTSHGYKPRTPNRRKAGSPLIPTARAQTSSHLPDARKLQYFGLCVRDDDDARLRVNSSQRLSGLRWKPPAIRRDL